MSATEAAGTVRRMIENCVNVHRGDLLEHFVHDDVRVHPGTPGAAPAAEGVEQLRQSFGRFRTIFPDLHVETEDVIAAHDRVVVRWTGTGTHSGEFAGIAPTGRTVRWGGIDIYRLADGKIAEWWRNDDLLGLLEQLGRHVL